MQKTLLALAILSQFILPAFAKANLDLAAPRFWNFQSIDTVKASRDLAREKLRDPAFDTVIDTQVKNIAATGATHVAIGTPYDDEFLPILARWVSAARRYHLQVWFRGNFAGWEGWFAYPKISRTEHMLKTEKFVLENSFYFEDGDIFTACPECENGQAGDPRYNGDLAGHREFLIAEYEIVKNDFQKLGKKVTANFVSMNGDVAKLVMDKETTTKLDGVVTIDHYVKTPDELLRDIHDLALTSGGKIVLGEYGYPIPDINGKATALEQAAWLEELLSKLVGSKAVIGLNYWTYSGGSTQLWNDSGQARPGVVTLTKFYTPPVVAGYVKDELDRPVSPATIKNEYGETRSNKNGYFEIPVPQKARSEVRVVAPGYEEKKLSLENTGEKLEIELHIQKKGFFFRLLEFFQMVLERIS